MNFRYFLITAKSDRLRCVWAANERAVLICLDSNIMVPNEPHAFACELPCHRPWSDLHNFLRQTVGACVEAALVHWLSIEMLSRQRSESMKMYVTSGAFEWSFIFNESLDTDPGPLQSNYRFTNSSTTDIVWSQLTPPMANGHWWTWHDRSERGGGSDEWVVDWKMALPCLVTDVHRYFHPLFDFSASDVIGVAATPVIALVSTASGLLRFFFSSHIQVCDKYTRNGGKEKPKSKHFRSKRILAKNFPLASLGARARGRKKRTCSVLSLSVHSIVLVSGLVPHETKALSNIICWFNFHWHQTITLVITDKRKTFATKIALEDAQPAKENQ